MESVFRMEACFMPEGDRSLFQVLIWELFCEKSSKSMLDRYKNLQRLQTFRWPLVKTFSSYLIFFFSLSNFITCYSLARKPRFNKIGGQKVTPPPPFVHSLAYGNIFWSSSMILIFYMGKNYKLFMQLWN